MTTAFIWDETCFWHSGGNYVLTAPVGGLVQPAAAGGLAENPETKRRLKNLLDVTGLLAELDSRSASPVTWEDMARVHPDAFLETFKRISESGGGETGLRTPYGPDGFAIAAQSAGLAKEALYSVLQGRAMNAYALSRPPGHHCMPDWQNGFCLLANIAIAVKAAQADALASRIAVLDWDVHHGNGTEAIFYEDPDVLTVSLHQEHNYPLDTGAFQDRGAGAGSGTNLNIPLPPGTGHTGYLAAIDRLALPAINAFQPDVIIVACGFDAGAFDPLSRTMATTETFRQMTKRTMALADQICDGKLVMVHEGGYSELHVPFAGHAVIAELAGSTIDAPDPFAETLNVRQPGPQFDAFLNGLIDDMATSLS